MCACKYYTEADDKIKNENIDKKIHFGFFFNLSSAFLLRVCSIRLSK